MTTHWLCEYELGHPEIDRDHRALIEVLAILSMGYCDRDLVDTQVKILERYVIDHFEHEESLMRQGGFPELAHHLDLHAQFRADVKRMRAEWVAGENPDLQAEIAAELSHWLINHIQGADRAYIPWILKT
ncbi:MAG: hemerythrin family protein [Phaeospirillum sp.]|nr:hemerythrin family protein [Phaeospirillum sp.]